MTEPQSAAGPLIHGIPLALWVTIAIAVASPLITLIIVWRSNANSRRNLRDQLAHDAQQRDLERKMSLRREVYLPAAAALTHTNALFARASNIELDQNMIADEFTADLATISKIHIVASDDTLDAVLAYMNELGPAFLEMTRRRMPLAIRKQMIETHVGLMNKAGADRERFITIMQQYNLQGIKDDDKWSAVNAQAQLAGEQFDSQRKTADQLRIDQVKGQLEISERAMVLAERHVMLLPDAVLAVRNEMGMPLDGIRYKRSMALQWEKMREAWAPLRSDLEQLIEKLEADAQPKVRPPPPST